MNSEEFIFKSDMSASIGSTDPAADPVAFAHRSVDRSQRGQNQNQFMVSVMMQNRQQAASRPVFLLTLIHE